MRPAGDVRRRRTSLGPLLGLLALTLLAGACPRHGWIERAYPPPAPAELRQMLVARQRAVASINGSARATSWLGGDRIRATVLVLVERAGRLRLEAEVSLQGTVAVLATDGQRFALLDVRKNELRRGPACPANIASLIRIPLAPAEVAAIFLGDARLPDGDAANDSVDWDGDTGTDVLVVPGGSGQLRYHFRHRDRGAPLLVGVTSVDDAGKPIWRVAFEEFVDVPSRGAAVSLPQVIHYAEGTSSYDDGVEIKFKDRTANDLISPDAFTLTPPPGTQTVEVGCH
jgi:hypothetical protein